MKNERPKLSLRQGEELLTHSCGGTHFALAQEGRTLRAYCIDCQALVQETEGFESRFSDEVARRMIRESYGVRPMQLISAEASGYRTHSVHMERIENGQAVCKTCGPVERGTADPLFHPEAYA